MEVKFVDLARQYSKIRMDVNSAMQEVIESSAFILSPHLKKFEEKFSGFCDSKVGIGTKSGTSALFLALKSLGIKEGDEVITTPFSFIASASSVSHAGAKPVFVDIDEDSYNINTSLIEKAITKKTKAIVAVHLYGQCADMGTINEIAGKHNISVIEDACQAHGATYKGKKSGSLGKAGCFSFYPTKNLGCFGDGGFITTNEEKIYSVLSLMRDHGQSRKYEHEVIGYNDRLDSIQAAILSVKLSYLEEWNESRRKNASIYNKYLRANSGIIIPKENDSGKHVYNVYAIRVKNRDKLSDFLKQRKIGTTIHYPIPIPFQKAYDFLGAKRGSFPVAEKVAKEILALPIYPDLRKEEIEYVCESINDFTRRIK